jgi:hypothetical protein
MKVRALTSPRAAPRMVAAAALLSFTFPAFPQESATTRSALAEIVENRDRCVEYVAIAKRELKSDRLAKARALYIEAYSSNSAWVASVKAAIREGRAKRLERDPVYERVSSKAAAAGKEFAEYVKAQTAAGPDVGADGRNPKSANAGFASPVAPVLALLVPLADLGIKIWKAHSEKVAAERQAAAEGFGRDAAWKAWDEVGSARPVL